MDFITLLSKMTFIKIHLDARHNDLNKEEDTK